MIRYARDQAFPRDELLEMLRDNHFKHANLSYHMHERDNICEYPMTVFALNPENFHALSRRLAQIPQIREYGILPTGN